MDAFSRLLMISLFPTPQDTLTLCSIQICFLCFYSPCAVLYFLQSSYLRIGFILPTYA